MARLSLLPRWGEGGGGGRAAVLIFQLISALITPDYCSWFPSLDGDILKDKSGKKMQGAWKNLHLSGKKRARAGHWRTLMIGGST